jgi:hypothetical protein
MPYFIYKVLPARQLEQLDVQSNYRDARRIVRALRAGSEPYDHAEFRMIFAPNSESAQRLLEETREARPLGEDE